MSIFGFDMASIVICHRHDAHAVFFVLLSALGHHSVIRCRLTCTAVGLRYPSASALERLRLAVQVHNAAAILS